MIKKIIAKVKEVVGVVKDKIIKHKGVIKKVLIGVAIGVAVSVAVPNIALADVSDTVPAASVEAPSQSIGEKIKEAVIPKEGIWEKGRSLVDEKMDVILENIEERTDQVLDKKLNWFEQKVFTFASEGLSNIFQVICMAVLRIPVALIYNPTIMTLYMKFVALGCALMPIILVFQYLKALMNDEHVQPLPLMVVDIIKGVLFMFGFAMIFPRLILGLNVATEAILAMGYNQLEFNAYLNMLGTDGLSVLGLFLSLGLILIVMVFLIIIFVTTGIRYWDICQLFVTAPIAYGMSVSPKTRFYYYIWQNNMKETLLAQLMYGIHLLIFTAVLSNPLPGVTDATLIKMMLLIGGIFRMTKIPGGLRDMLSRGHEEERIKGFAKGAFSTATNIPTGGEKK